jgi:hypothetical protein
VATLVDRTRGRVRLVSYSEASRSRRDLLEIANDQFARFVIVKWTICNKVSKQFSTSV